MTKKNLTEKELQSQNSLTKDRLQKNLTPKKAFTPRNIRPEYSLIELINWVTSELYSSDVHLYGSYIHNKIVMNGDFLQFCEKNNIDVKCILKDSIASWKNEVGFETFLAQGIFQITTKNLTFIHCALFHKGNQNEDEVSFFIIVHNNMYDDYIKFRNDYEEWQRERDRNSQEINVVGGEPISYDNDLTWNDVCLPDEIKNDIKSSVEGFINSEKFYKENKIPWKRGMIFWGKPGTGKTLTIKTIISEYGFKPVTIQPGHPQKDQLLAEAFEYAQEHGPSLLFIEDLPELIQSMDASAFLQLLDGVKSREGLLVIATANDVSKIPENLTDRPSRFDRKIKFPTPDETITIEYLKSWFKNHLKLKDFQAIAKKTVKKEFTFAYLKELYISSAHIALSDNRKYPVLKDVEKALQFLLQDKSYVETGFGLRSISKMDLTGMSDDDY